MHKPDYSRKPDIVYTMIKVFFARTRICDHGISGSCKKIQQNIDSVYIFAHTHGLYNTKNIIVQNSLISLGKLGIFVHKPDYMSQQDISWLAIFSSQVVFLFLKNTIK